MAGRYLLAVSKGEFQAGAVGFVANFEVTSHSWFTLSWWNWIAPLAHQWWSSYWHIVGVGLPILLTVITGIWFTWGGVRDIYDLFRALSRKKVNELDDGTVVDHQNLEELAVLPEEF